MLCREVNAAYSENHTRFENTLCGQNVEFRKLNLVLNKITTFFKVEMEKSLLSYFGCNFIQQTFRILQVLLNDTHVVVPQRI